jgi:hypothetical protein
MPVGHRRLLDLMRRGHGRGDASQPVAQRGQLSCLDTAVIPDRLAALVGGQPRRRARWRPAMISCRLPEPDRPSSVYPNSMISALGVNCGRFTVAGDGSWLGVIEPAEQLFL